MSFNKSKGTDNQSLASKNVDLCNSCNLTAASPRGSLERPLSMSLTEDCVSPMAAPISATVIPFRRRSEMREDQVIMDDSIRNTDILCNRHSATEFRKNRVMARPPEMPELDTIGARIQWWRKRRGMTQKQLVLKSGLSQSTISGWENDNQVSSTKLHLVAKALDIDLHYLETGEGDPEPVEPVGQAPTPSQLPPWWPFKTIGKAELMGLNEVERGYAEAEFARILATIASVRRKKGS